MQAVLGFSRNTFGLAGMLLGAAGMVLVVLHFWMGPFTPQKSLERTIAETAVAISKEVVRVIKDKPAVMKVRTWTIDEVLRIVGSALAVGAVLLAAIGFVRREDHRLVIMGGSLGVGVIMFQFVTWLALLAAGLILLWIIISNLGEILGSAGV